MTSEATRRRIEGPRAPRPEPSLTEMTGVELLTRVKVLTHRIDAADRDGHVRGSELRLSDLRAERDAVEAEVLRRMGGLQARRPWGLTNPEERA